MECTVSSLLPDVTFLTLLPALIREPLNSSRLYHTLPVSSPSDVTFWDALKQNSQGLPLAASPNAVAPATHRMRMAKRLRKPPANALMRAMLRAASHFWLVKLIEPQLSLAILLLLFSIISAAKYPNILQVRPCEKISKFLNHGCT